MRRSEGGPTFDSFFLVDEGREYPNTTIAGHHPPASGTPFKWRFAGMRMMAQAGSFVIFRVSRPILVGNPIFL